LWRDGDFDHSTETLIQREFGAALTRADHKYRADRLLYVESFESALRAAALAGADIIALARRRWVWWLRRRLRLRSCCPRSRLARRRDHWFAVPVL
jgi:hypothetical protein